jgi:hypothetical protein
VESLDSGLGSFDSSHSGSKSPKPEIGFQASRKRKRSSDGADISDDSAIEGDDKVDSTTKMLHTKQSNSKKLKKLKVSEFMKQVLAS